MQAYSFWSPAVIVQQGVTAAGVRETLLGSRDRLAASGRVAGRLPARVSPHHCQRVCRLSQRSEVVGRSRSAHVTKVRSVSKVRSVRLGQIRSN
eukprot:scaffold26818_cov59-Phaeocystis_antarctica.AAC.1